MPARIPFRIGYEPVAPELSSAEISAILVSAERHVRPTLSSEERRAILASAEALARAVTAESARRPVVRAFLASSAISATLDPGQLTDQIETILTRAQTRELEEEQILQDESRAQREAATQQVIDRALRWLLQEVSIPAGLGLLAYTLLLLASQANSRRVMRRAKALRDQVDPRDTETRLAEAQEALSGDPDKLRQRERERKIRERRAAGLERRARTLELRARLNSALSHWLLTFGLITYLIWLFIHHDGLRVIRLLNSTVVIQVLVGRAATIIIIILTINLILAGARFLIGRLVLRVRGASSQPGGDRDLQAQTLANVLASAASVLLWTLGLFMVLDQLGLDITTLLAAAGVAGIAIGFGAQTLVRDFLAGFFIILENQFRVGDVVKIGDTGGLVERITLRATSLRDLSGSLHVIPNGSIQRVTNMTFLWSRYVADIGISYSADPDQVIALLADVGKRMRREEPWGERMLEDPEVVGLDRFEDSALVFRVLLKTKPLQQWAVGREFNRRVKYALDEAGIEIPFPHRTVYLRLEPEDELAQVLRGATRPGGEPLSPR